MKMLRNLTRMLATVTVIGLLGGCGTKNTPADANAGEATEGGPDAYPYVQRLEPVEPVDGEIGAAAYMLGLGQCRGFSVL